MGRMTGHFVFYILTRVMFTVPWTEQLCLLLSVSLTNISSVKDLVLSRPAMTSHWDVGQWEASAVTSCHDSRPFIITILCSTSCRPLTIICIISCKSPLIEFELRLCFQLLDFRLWFVISSTRNKYAQFKVMRWNTKSSFLFLHLIWELESGSFFIYLQYKVCERNYNYIDWGLPMKKLGYV